MIPVEPTQGVDAGNPWMVLPTTWNLLAIPRNKSENQIIVTVRKRASPIRDRLFAMI